MTGPLNAKGILVAVNGQPQALAVGGLRPGDRGASALHVSFSLVDSTPGPALDPRHQLPEQRGNEPAGRCAGATGSCSSGDDLPSDVNAIPIRPVFLLSDDEERRTKQVEVNFNGPDRPMAESGDAHLSAASAPQSNAVSSTGGGGRARSDFRTSGPGGQGTLGCGDLAGRGLGGGPRDSAGARQDARHGRRACPACADLPTCVAGAGGHGGPYGKRASDRAALWYTRATQVGDLHRGLTRAAGFAIAAVGLWRVGRWLGGYPEHEQEEMTAGGEMSNVAIAGLGLAGGIVPCWDAVGLLVLAAAVDRLGAGVALVLAFSAGMATVLVAVGWLVWKLKSKALDPDRASRWQRGLGLACGLLLAAMGLYLFLGS